MGMSVSCPLNTDDLDNPLETFLVRPISSGDDGEKPTYRASSFNGRESEPMLLKSCSGRKFLTRSSSFRVREQKIMNMNQSPRRGWREIVSKLMSRLNWSNNNEIRNSAAIRLQKTYKSFRTRRRLADCAVLVEQRWWKALDFAELKRTSVSFFDIEKQESAVSRWSRARTRAAKVGKGLSQDEKARKLALQHWLEAIDPRHRYGHNLQFYYVNWLQCESKQPFFYWLDIGEGKEVNLEKCNRPKLQHQCIKYLGPMERKEFEVVIEDGRLKYKENKKILDSREGPEGTKWIFVLSVSRILYVGQKKKGTFQHSSFLAGGATLSAGRLVVEDGILQAVWPHSGHYLPTEENFEEFVSFLKQHGVDLTHVQKSPTEEDEMTNNEKDKNDLSQSNYMEQSSSRRAYIFQKKITSIEIPKRENMLEIFSYDVERRRQPQGKSCIQSPPVNGYDTADENLSDTEYSVSKDNLFDEDEEEEYEEIDLHEKIMNRINSHKEMKSYQLAQQLSCRWTTGAGPRIGCVRDYPSELQFRALEEVLLSPRSSHYSSPRLYDRYSPRIGNTREKNIGKSPLAFDAFNNEHQENK